LSQLYAAIPLLLSSTNNPTTTQETDPFHIPLYQLEELTGTTVSNTSNEFQERLDQLNLATDRSHFQRLFSTRRTMSDGQRLTSRSKSARSFSKKKANNESEWLTDTPRLNRYILQKHEDNVYGTLHTPRSKINQQVDDDLFLSTARSTLTDLSLTTSINLNNNANQEQSSVYCPSVEEVRRYVNFHRISLEIPPRYQSTHDSYFTNDCLIFLLSAFEKEI